MNATFPPAVEHTAPANAPYTISHTTTTPTSVTIQPVDRPRWVAFDRKNESAIRRAGFDFETMGRDEELTAIYGPDLGLLITRMDGAEFDVRTSGLAAVLAEHAQIDLVL